jgi:hypothetical protein
LERAGRFLYLGLALGGKVAERSFGIPTAGSSRLNITWLDRVLEDIHSRLAGVVIALTYSPCASSDAFALAFGGGEGAQPLRRNLVLAGSESQPAGSNNLL